jgi:membrane protein involved in colicin uptake
MGTIIDILSSILKKIYFILHKDVTESKINSNYFRNLVKKKETKGNSMQDLNEVREENEQLKKNIAQQNQQLEQLKQQLDNYEKDKTDRENALKTQAEDQRRQEVEALLKQAIDAKKIPAKNEDIQNTFRAMLMNDFDNTKAILATIPAMQNDKPEVKPPTNRHAENRIDLREQAESAYANSSQN